MLWSIAYGGIYAYKQIHDNPIMIVLYIIAVVVIAFIYKGIKSCITIMKSY